tara:strand:- start:2065 stop:2412 length:348 start_codon:yes stop_codon:yes gene_type:complete
MNTFTTKFNSCLSATDELQYIKRNDSAPSTYKENAPRQKQPNYKMNLVKAVASGKSLYLHQDQLTGKGVSVKQKIYKPITQTEIIASAQSPFGKIDGWSKQRLLKKEGVIYDLLN